jgi:CheY-like chemotaxis protein
MVRDGRDMSRTTVPDRATASAASLLPSILVVDADEDTRALYRQSFQLMGCDVVEATDGRDALTKALVQPPTLVLTEIALPFLDGYSLCEILRRDRTTADVPILVVTVEAERSEMDRARQAGADVVLVKPTPIEQVWQEMQRLIADSKKQHRPVDSGPSATTAPQDDSAETLRPSDNTHRAPLSKSFSRFTTTTPRQSPPTLVCPECDRPLTYDHSNVGGVSERHSEQWDNYVCQGSCGTFQYRQRTRKLRRVL